MLPGHCHRLVRKSSVRKSYHILEEANKNHEFVPFCETKMGRLMIERLVGGKARGRWWFDSGVGFRCGLGNRSRRRDYGPSIQYFLYRLNQGVTLSFGHDLANPNFLRFQIHLRRRMQSMQDQGDLRKEFGEFAGRGEAVHRGHDEVENNHVRLELADEPSEGGRRPLRRYG